jgi:hypothetical protein
MSVAGSCGVQFFKFYTSGAENMKNIKCNQKLMIMKSNLCMSNRIEKLMFYT